MEPPSNEHQWRRATFVMCDSSNNSNVPFLCGGPSIYLVEKLPCDKPGPQVENCKKLFPDLSPQHNFPNSSQNLVVLVTGSTWMSLNWHYIIKFKERREFHKTLGELALKEHQRLLKCHQGPVVTNWVKHWPTKGVEKYNGYSSTYLTCVFLT